MVIVRGDMTLPGGGGRSSEFSKIGIFKGNAASAEGKKR